MAEIRVERKPERGAGGWIAALVVVLLLLGAAWYFVLGPGRAYIDGGEAGDGSADVTAPVSPGAEIGGEGPGR